MRKILLIGLILTIPVIVWASTGDPILERVPANGIYIVHPDSGATLIAIDPDGGVSIMTQSYTSTLAGVIQALINIGILAPAPSVPEPFKGDVFYSSTENHFYSSASNAFFSRGGE